MENINKTNYLIFQLGRTNKKNYENYCITRIYHLLNRTDIQFITQQMFKRGESKIALADLYLPQLDVWVEIDESHDENQSDKDKKRTEEVINHKKNRFEEIINIENEPERIIIINKTLDEINEQIDNIVKKIKEKIIEKEKNKTFVKWKVLFEQPEFYINKKSINVSDRAAFRTIKEVSDLFNKNYSGFQKGCFDDKKEGKILVWCPKLKFEKTDNGQWDIFISADGNTIEESSKLEKFNFKGYIDAFNQGYTTRYVFAKFRDSSGIDMYRFRGIFKLNVERTKKEEKAIWVKIGEEIDLSEYFN